MKNKTLSIGLVGVESILIVKTKSLSGKTRYKVGITNIRKTEEEDIARIEENGNLITKEKLLQFFED